jgi:uncharacterized membrane protein YfcA
VSDPQFAAALLVLALAAFVQGVFGLGFAMIATPLLALFLDYQTAVLVAAVPLFVLAVYWLTVNRLHLFRSVIPWTLLPGIVTGAALGVALQVSLPQKVTLLLLAALILFSVMLPLIQRRWISESAMVSVSSAPWFGLFAGVTEAALNVGAPFMVLFAGLARLSRLQLLIALNVCFALGKSIQIALLMIVAPTPLSLPLLIAGVMVCLLAFWVGDRLAGRQSETGFHSWLRVFLVAMATLLVIRSQFIT